MAFSPARRPTTVVRHHYPGYWGNMRASLGELIETSVSLTSPWKLMLLIPWLDIDAARPQGKCLTEVSDLNFFTVVEIGDGPGNFQYSVVRTY